MGVTQKTREGELCV